MKENFTIAELEAIDSEFIKRALASVDFYTSLPCLLVCIDPNTPW